MLVDVALPVPVPRTFTYRVEQGAVEVGSRVLVPFGRRRLIGWVVGHPPEAGPGVRIRAVSAVLDAAPSLTADLLRLCRWVADYYVAPLGQVLRSALPAVLSQPGRPAPPVKTRRILRLVRELPSLARRDEIFGRAQRQRELYELLETIGGSAEVSHLTGHVGFSESVVRGLVAKGLAELADEEVERDPFAVLPPAEPAALTLTAAQRAAVDALVAASRGGRGGTFLLRGVTGSGKTQVYIELLEEVVQRQGRGAIVLVPEIALTPQTVSRFRAHFGETVAVLHSALSDGERYDAWRALRSGERKIAVGARSAVFAPVADLGAIVVDEEHEATYKQSDAPRYHAREVAIVRAGQAGAVCVLGSATPSLESWRNARAGKYRLLELPDRVEGRPLPPVHLVDLRPRSDGSPSRTPAPGAAPHGADTDAAAPAAGDRAAGPAARGSSGDAAFDRILSPPLVAAIRARLERREQTILLLNRRGYATFVQCRDCGRVWHCRQCNVSLTYHRSRRRLVCHYCFHEEPAPVTCDDCASGDLSFRGVGTEQVERAVADAFPYARIARMDVDTTSGKWAHHEILGRVERGEVDILLGTQMIAKGLDFPRVTLVGVVNADVGINLPDFRASERTFQLLTQVAGRAGRGDRRGEVFIQTALPGHYAIRAAIAHDYATFAERELAEREAPRYPPFCRLANVILSGTDEDAVVRAAEETAAWVRRMLADEVVHGVEVMGPAPCPIDRIRGRWRWHFLLRSASPAPLGAVLRRLHERGATLSGRGALRLALDRDPVSLL
ncbi:MAG TPA: primosomal protein N' [Longimicrobiales bacterium]